MRILAFDTATRATTVAIWCSAPAPGGQLLAHVRDDPPSGVRPRHTTMLISSIVAALTDAGLDWDEVDRIAVGIGPGTFTGLRIGIATARALAKARGIPLVGVSTLESVASAAAGALAAGWAGEVEVGAIYAVLDARRREVFASAWRAPDDGRGLDWPAILDPAALTPGQLASLIEAGALRSLAVGDGAVEFREVLERAGAVVPDDGSGLHRVSALEHCRLASGARPSDPELVAPDYIRLPDAQIALGGARRR